MLRTILFRYTRVLGIIKAYLYKAAYLSDLHFEGVPNISSRARIRIRKGGKLLLKKKAHMDEGTLLRVTKGASLSIGEGSGFNSYCVVTCRDRIEIGNNVIIGPFVTMHDHDHIYKGVQDYSTSGYNTAPIIIEDNVWIGGNVIILKGVRIGRGSVIAAGTTVTKDVPPFTMVYDRSDRTERQL